MTKENFFRGKLVFWITPFTLLIVIFLWILTACLTNWTIPV